MHYGIVIEKLESNYSAYVPDLPRCVATGATIEEIEQQIKEVISLRHGFAYRFSFGWFARRGFTHSENQLLYVNISKLVENAIALRAHVAIALHTLIISNS